MSVDSILAAFQAAAAAGRVDGTTMPLLGELVETLGVASLPLTSGRAAPAGDTAVLTGGTSWRQTGWSLAIVGDSPGGVDHLVLTMSAPATGTAWTFTQSFPDLPESRRLSTTVDGTLALVRSVIADLVLDLPQVGGEATDGLSPQPQARLQGWLQLTDSLLAPYIPYLGASRLWLDGPLDFTDPESPLLSLVAAAPAADADVPKMNVSGIGLRLRNDYPDVESLDVPPPPTSVVELLYRIDLGGRSSNEVTLSAPLLQGGMVWPLDALIEPPVTLSDGIVGLMSLFPGAKPSDFTLPAGIAPLDLFGISALQFGVIPGVPPGISYSGVTLVSTSAWDVPVPFVKIEQVGTRWLFNWENPVLATGSVWGVMAFGSKGPSDASLGAASTTSSSAPAAPRDSLVLDSDGQPVLLYVQVDLPSFDILAETRGDIQVPLSDTFGAYFTGPKPDVPAGLVVEKISVTASMLNQTYGASLYVRSDWEIPIGNVSFILANIFFEMAVTQSKVSGSLQGFVGVEVNGEQKALLTAGAAYPGGGNWVFEGGLAAGELDLTEFAFAFLGETPPDWLPSLVLTKLWASYSTADGNPYSASAAVAVRWDPDVLGIKLSLLAEADVRRYQATNPADQIRLAALARRTPRLAAAALPPGASLDDALAGRALAVADDAPVMTYAGSVKGVFELNRLLITVGLSFVSDEMTYLFRFQLERFALEARTSWTGAGAKRHQVLTVTMEGATLGELVESFARLANPNTNYRLEAPWSFLNKIDLGRFTLILDPAEQTVTLDYRLNLELGFITITSVGLNYRRTTGEPQILFELTGKFLGKTYDRSGNPGTQPLAWDAVNDAPPAVPGKGIQLIDLKYLGFGQHVDLTGLTNPNSVADIIALMQEQMKPSKDPTANPLDQPSGSQLRFSESSQWLIGLDATLMSTVSISLVMHDPDLYGLLIRLAGPEAGALAGLSFELLYKKVTDDIGVFHVRLQVPDAFRQFDFGAVAITLGIVTVDIFTNGNFMVDLGFPHNRDFSVSFGLQYGPFLGRGGIYFGLLNGATSTRVPKVTNGAFDPVLELGIGFAVGVGRTFNKGPLKAGLYVELEVIFQGVLGWFHPDDAAKPTAMYYWARASASLVGRLYGSVDFKVISIDIDIEASASVTLTLEAYKATLVEMRVRVSVRASIKILFVRISFSFGMTIEASFTVGSDSPTPWVLAPGQSGRSNQSRTLGAFAQRRRRPFDVRRHTLLSRLSAARGGGLAGHAQARAALDSPDPCADYDLVWTPARKLFPDALIHDVYLKMLPAFTVADVPVAWTGGTVPPNLEPHWRLDFILLADSAVPPSSDSIAETHRLTAEHSAQSATPQEISFATLTEAMLRWSISALGLDPAAGTVTAGEISHLAAQLDCPQTMDQGFAFDALSILFGENLLLKLSGIPAGDPLPQGGVAFPMPPILKWTSPDLPVVDQRDRDFAVYQPIDAVYQAEVAAYFANLDPRAEAHRPTLQAIGDDEAENSMASFVFRDYMALIAKTAVQQAEALLSDWPCDFGSDDTLESIARPFPKVDVPYVKQAGDTVDQVAAEFGISAAELLALNDGFAAELAAAPPGETLLVKLGVTPESLAAGNPQWPLADGKIVPAELLVTQVRDSETLTGIAARLHADLAAWLQTDALLDRPGILRPQAPLTLDGLAYANPDALGLREVAAVFYTRLPVGTDYPHSDWYAEAIVQLNGQTIGADGALPATILVPAAFDDITAPESWTRLPGDSLVIVARTVALIQNPVAGSDFEAYAAAVATLNPTPGAVPVRLPDAVSPIQPDETLRSLATRLLQVDSATVPPAPEAAFDAFAAAADILQPLAEIAVTGASLPTAEGRTLAEFAQTYDLTVEDVGRLGAEVPGLLATGGELPLRALSVPAIGINELVAQVLSGAPAATISGQVSRFMLHGQRIPAPALGADGHYHATGPLTGLYDLTGQQVTGPAPDPESELDLETIRATVTVSLDEPTAWLQFMDSVAAGEADTAETLAARHPRLAELNPAVALDGRFRTGLVLLTDEVDQLVFAISEAQLEEGYPATGLVPTFAGGLAPMTLFKDVAVRHPLSQTVRWQTPVPPAFPAFAGDAARAGMPGLWPFPAELTAKAAEGGDTAWLLHRTDPALGPDSPSVVVANYVWASLIDLRIQRVPGRPNTYELFGADTAGRQLLLEAWRHLADTADTAELNLLYQLSAAAGLPPGLTSAPLDPALTYLVKTNLSTETRSGARQATLAAGEDPPSWGDYYATIADGQRFLTLLWEASVVGGGGYWLEVTGTDGAGLPDQIFGSEGGGLLTLMIVLGSQSSSTPSRALLPFNTCALVADPLDPSAAALFVEAGDGSETVRQATVSPGEAGFELTLDMPAVPDGEETKQTMLQQLYGLVGYQLVDGTAFAGSNQGKPIGPQTGETPPAPEETLWRLSQLIPVRRFAKSNPLPAVTGLPDPGNDPYAGISPRGPDPSMAHATVALWFRDVFGNSSAIADGGAGEGDRG